MLPLCSPGSVASTNSTVATSSCIKPTKILRCYACPGHLPESLTRLGDDGTGTRGEVESEWRGINFRGCSEDLVMQQVDFFASCKFRRSFVLFFYMKIIKNMMIGRRRKKNTLSSHDMPTCRLKTRM